ncbi:TIGR01777 family oxidoreductase [Paenibacillus sp. SC116]|uniref:TIGR01777 family oxidoreductase n=1 Tax=Paenibacillus sp. SC116 TaxID=2968986 RepID=UPI00215B01B0|nr:TIGR01777 family oxidoreductase [Paenibacillus sp. SC116]MCR8844004.1 TIGR01777 family oxidoreductase [Paenibacillus sp. SC116]
MLLSGGTGLIGTKLAEKWLHEGHEVIILTRSMPAVDNSSRTRQPFYLTWSQLAQMPAIADDVDVVVNLAGETINQRWNENAKERIRKSRLEPTRQISDWAAKRHRTLPLLISASGSSVYGSSKSDRFDEMSPPAGQDFLSDVVRQWEAAADQVPAQRTVKLRIAPVLSSEGGALQKILLPYRFGVGGRLGSGQQPFSWIHIDDIIRLIDYIAHDKSICGVINASAPESVTNEEFGRKISSIYQKPHWLPMPAAALKLMLGEMSILVLEGQHVFPMKALQHGFKFRYPTVEKALLALKEK